jgi:hypothetical protein
MVWGEKLTNFGKIGNNRLLRRTIVFFCLITAAFASETLNALVNASAAFFGCDLATTRGGPRRSDADHPCRKDDFVCESENVLFHGFA